MTWRPARAVWTAAADTGLAVSLADAREHLRLDASDEDAMLRRLIRAAAAQVEKRTGRLLSPRACTLRLSGFPPKGASIPLRGGTVSAVGSVAYITPAGASATMAGGAVEAVGDSPAMLMAADWPATATEGLPVTVSYTAGFATAPDDLAAAVLLIAAEMFERRHEAGYARLTTVPVNAEWLMSPHRIYAVG